jgi:hypothetical protein
LERVFSDVDSDPDKPFYFRPIERKTEVLPIPPPPPTREEWKADHLKRRTTRELISDLRLYRRGSQDFHHDDEPVFVRGVEYTAAEVKAELALRPHIPSKAESRKNRMRAAKNHRGGKRDR